MHITQGADTSALPSTPQSSPAQLLVLSTLVQTPLLLSFLAIYSLHILKGLGEAASSPFASPSFQDPVLTTQDCVAAQC